MITRGGSWQMVIADLALILFMVSVSAMGRKDAETAPLNPLPARGEPSAIYRASPGAPTLAEWLADEAPDPRQLLTIIVRYEPDGADKAASEAVALSRQAGNAATRIILEPSDQAETLAVLSYDDPDVVWHENCLSPLVEGGSLVAGKRILACE